VVLVKSCNGLQEHWLYTLGAQVHPWYTTRAGRGGRKVEGGTGGSLEWVAGALIFVEGRDGLQQHGVDPERAQARGLARDPEEGAALGVGTPLSSPIVYAPTFMRYTDSSSCGILQRSAQAGRGGGGASLWYTGACQCSCGTPTAPPAESCSAAHRQDGSNT